MPAWESLTGPIGIAIVVLALAAGIGWVVHRVARGMSDVARAGGDAATRAIHAPADAATTLAHGVAGAFRAAFQSSPSVRVENDVVCEAPREISKLVVLTQELREHTTWTHSRWHSEKRLQLSGVYTAELGFDLARVRVDVAREPLTLRVSLPPVEVVLQTEREEIESSRSGLWNRITDADRTEALATLRRGARGTVERSEALAQARERVLAIVREQAELHAARIELVDAGEAANQIAFDVLGAASATPAKA